LNPYGLPRQILSLVRLPISPLPHCYYATDLTNFIPYFLISRFLLFWEVSALVFGTFDDVTSRSTASSEPITLSALNSGGWQRLRDC
jgi:hypothetical protein